MTESEAKGFIQGKLDCMEKCDVFNKEDKHSNNECELCEYCYSQGNFGQQKEAFQMALQALEKQIPKKPRKTDSYRGVLKRVYAYVCPTCGNACLEKYMNERQNTMFCWNCGQKLDWSEENE